MHSDSTNKPARPQPRLIRHWRCPRTVPVKAMQHKHRTPEPDDPVMPCANLHGMWMTLAGISVGMDLFVEFGSGWVTLRTAEALPVGHPARKPAATGPIGTR